MNLNKYAKIVVLNLIIIVIAVVSYSPGLLALRPGDASIFRAGMSILTAIFLLAVFLYGNLHLLSDKKPRLEADDLMQAKRILNMYKNGSHFGGMASTVLDQLNRLGRSMERLQAEIDRKFEKRSMTNDKYSAIVNDANLSLVDNLISATHRIQFFDEDEYVRLLDHKRDNIPDDIQLKQLDLYKSNEEAVKNVITANEKLILQLDTLAVELSRSDGSDESLLEEIKQLTKEVKYYK